MGKLIKKEVGLSNLTMPSSLFKENAAERFRRESQEIWEKSQLDSDSSFKNLSRENSVEKQTSPNDIEKPFKQIEVKLTTKDIPKKAAVISPTPPDLFPRRVKSKLIRPKPNLWEKTQEETKNLKNTLLRKEAEVVTRRKK